MTVAPFLTNPKASVALADISTASPTVLLALGPDLHSGQQLSPWLAAVVSHATSSLTSTIISEGTATDLAVAASSTLDPNLVAVAFSPITPTRPTPNNSGPYRDFYINLYNGTKVHPGNLLLTTYGPRRLPAPVGRAVVRVGALTWLVTASARPPSGGAYVAATPWIALGIGVLLALVLAFTVEIFIRRATRSGRLYIAQRELAEALQAALLPKELPAHEWLEIAGRYLAGVAPLEIGGDWYDVIELDDDHFVVVVGDVSGRGLDAAGAMAALRFSIRAHVLDRDPLSVVLSKVAGLLRTQDSGQFATVLCVSIEISTRRVTLVSAGHLPPVTQSDGSATVLEVVPGPPIGVGQDYERPREPIEVTLPVGAILCAYTDGLVERRGEPISAGVERLGRSLSDATGPVSDILEHLLKFLAPDGPNDDVAVVALRW